jgi:toxin ParE1/3/4
VSAFFISHKAEADLRDIRSFTIERWGKEVARRYLRELQATFLRLADHPGRAREVPKRPGVRYARCGRHVVYYEVRATVVLVIRVLHERMLPDQHL